MFKVVSDICGIITGGIQGSSMNFYIDFDVMTEVQVVGLQFEVTGFVNV